MAASEHKTSYWNTCQGYSVYQEYNRRILLGKIFSHTAQSGHPNQRRWTVLLDNTKDQQ